MNLLQVVEGFFIVRRFVDYLHGTGLSERSVHDNLVICSVLWTFANDEFGFPHVVKGIELPAYVEVYLELASVDTQRPYQANSPADNWRL